MAKLCVIQILGDYNPPPDLGFWGGSGVPMPTPPIYIPTPPLGTWGGSGQPFPGYGLPQPPPGTWGGAGQPFPTPPIHLPGGGGKPPGTWGGSGEPFPGYGLPDTPPPDGIPEDPQGQWIWIPGLGWVWKPGAEDMQPHQAQPK